jgi:hypothetical protein
MFCYLVFTFGFIIANFWSWFVLPIFTNLPTITWQQSVGLGMFMGALNFSHLKNMNKLSWKNENNDKAPLRVLGLIFIVPLLVLFMGYLVKVWIV